jgi:uncharacterized Zn finger protein (UPF0148 family)
MSADGGCAHPPTTRYSLWSPGLVRGYDHGMQEASYHARTSDSADPYVVAWTRLRWRRLLAVFCFVAWLPAMGVVGYFVERIFDQHTTAKIVSWLATSLLLSSASFIGMSCPHCGNPLLQKRWYGNAFARRCMSCGIRIGTPKSAARIEEASAPEGRLQDRPAVVEHVEAEATDLDADGDTARSARETR